MLKNLSSGENDKNSIIIRRRRFISNVIHSDGRISEAEIRRWLKNNEAKKVGLELTIDSDSKRFEPGTFSLKAIRNDIEFIEAYEEKQIFEKRDPSTKELEWIDNSRKLGATRKERLQYNFLQKSQIAEVLSALVLGLTKFTINREPDGEELKISHVASIRSECKKYPHYSDLLLKLEAFWRHGERSIFLDSGTTTHIFAQDFLQYFRLPMDGDISPTASEEQSVNKIEIITNDRHIFYCLGEPHVHAKTIIVGGRQQFRSTTISGMMAQNFMNVNSLRAGMSIVATTGICMIDAPGEHSYLCAENEHVAAIKHQFLERSGLRIAVADSSKFQQSGAHGDTRICSIKKNNIDLVLTDHADQNTISHFEKLGVPLISYSALNKID